MDESRTPTVIVDDVHVVYRVKMTGQMGNAANALRRIVRSEGGGSIVREIHAVRGVSLTAYEGDAIGLIGKNGSGKSTLLQAITGTLPVQSGTVFTSAKPTLLGVHAALAPEMTGMRNIILGCLAQGMTRAEAEASQKQIADFADLGDFIELPMRTYSSGMAARLRFAIASVRSHEILMVDEALATGDAAFRRKSENRIKELREEAGTVFLVSHSLGVVKETCNRAVWLEDGQVVLDGDSAEVIDAYNERYDPRSTA